MNQLIRKINKIKYLYLFVFIITLIVSLQSILKGSKTFPGEDTTYTQYNNYIIFKDSFHHLIQHKDLYAQYPLEHWDIYKYTPTFSLFFGIFSLFPDWLGLTLWNITNSILLSYAIFSLPFIDFGKKRTILFIIFIELITSLQNSQSNALICALLILSFSLLNKGNYKLSTFCLVGSLFIKPFGIVGGILYLLYPKSIKSILYIFLWTLLFISIPLTFLSLDNYMNMLQGYLHMIKNDHDVSYGISAMGVVNSLFQNNINKLLIVAIGATMFLLPFIHTKHFKNIEFRYLTLASILIWIVIFNHKAESPTFIIAMCGVSIWFVISKSSAYHFMLLFFALLITSLSSTDIFPKTLRNNYVIPYSLKALPCILVWFNIIYEMLMIKKRKSTLENANINN